MKLESSAPDSLTFSWGVSPLASFYAIYHRKHDAARADISDGFVLSQSVDSSASQATISDLTSGVTYEVLVLAGRGNATEQVGSRLLMTTTSSSDNVVVDPGLGTSGSIIAGASVAGVVALLVILVIVVVLIRRRQARTKASLDQFGGSQALEVMREYRSTLSRSRGSMKHAESTTHLSFADKTIVNTVLEVSLPGFLQLDYPTSLQPGNSIDSADGRSVYVATLLDRHVSSRVGCSTVAVYDYDGDFMLSPYENEARFHHEVSLMWSLSFHPNVVALLGYTDEPRTIVTRLYAATLFDYLQSTPEISDMLMAQLASGLASGLNAIHSMQVAHRDLNPHNILIEQPSSSDQPKPIIGNFSHALSPSGPPSRRIVTMQSMRYSAPEVFARITPEGETEASPDMESEFAADVYSLGAVYYLLLSGDAPWQDIPEEKVGAMIERGHRLSPPHVAEKEDSIVRIMLSAVATSCIGEAPTERPGIAVVAHKVSAHAPHDY